MDQWDKTANAIILARYDCGPAETANAIADAMRTLAGEMIKAGTDAAIVAASVERDRCLAALQRYSGYQGEDDPFDLVAAAIRPRTA